ncbi:hypothetical protein [Absidia glauca]|uniref:FYVE-type domain-containing protein n=1 Tax=Absidia glauca TaxID=4829 RepID=A0A168PTE9_ABSGL|nr:hypothetical protein [Absidia glauca]
MQSYFYTFSLNNPLLSDVDLEASQIFFTSAQRPQRTFSKAPQQKQPQPLKNRRKTDNRLSTLTGSTLSDDEPITPRSLHRHQLQTSLKQQQQQQIYTTTNKVTLPSYDPITLPMDKNGITALPEDRTTFSTVNDTNDESDTIWHQEEPSDDPETVRSHITTITRSMQAFHVRELVWDEATAAKKRKRLHRSASDHHHVPHLSAWTIDQTPPSTINYHPATNNSMDHLETGLTIQPLAQQFDNEQCGLPTKQTCSTLSSSPFAEKEASIQQLWNPADSVPDNTPQQWTMEDATLPLLSLASTVQDQFYEREKHYQDQLHEFEVAGQRQSMMLDTLDELMLDMDTKLSAASSSTFLHQEEQHTDSTVPRWLGDTQPALEPSSLVTMGTDSFVHKARWKVGMLFGSDVGTGDIIQTFQPSVGVEMLISGSGIIMDDIQRATLDQKSIHTSIITKSHHTKMALYRYQLRLSPHDRHTRFVLLPKHQWIPDLFVDQCQMNDDDPHSPQCSVRFNLIQRKHHCRRCGKIICQKHSGNRLPLFNMEQPDQGGWYRACDSCFIQLISS